MIFEKIGIITENPAEYHEAKKIISGDSDIRCYYPQSKKHSVVYMSPSVSTLGYTDNGMDYREFIEKNKDYRLVSIQEARKMVKGKTMILSDKFTHVGIKCVTEQEYRQARDFLSLVTGTPRGGYYWSGQPSTVFVYQGKFVYQGEIDVNTGDYNPGHYLKQYDFKDIAQILLDEIKPSKNVIINKHYTATVSHGQIQVGGVTISKKVVEEIISAWNELNV